MTICVWYTITCCKATFVASVASGHYRGHMVTDRWFVLQISSSIYDVVVPICKGTFVASFAWWIFLWAYGHGSTFSCLQGGRRKKGILGKFPATVTRRQCCTFLISIILAHNADVSLRVHVFVNYHFWRHLIAQCLTGELHRNMLPH